ncbi:hypothetical protein ACFVDU_17600 [Streptomyces albidoflavus]
MAKLTGQHRCGDCGKEIVGGGGRGRPRDYCDRKCRGRAQRKRDRELRRGAVLSFASASLAKELMTEVRGLAYTAGSDSPLDEVLAAVRRITNDVELVGAAAVREARSQGMPWEDVARADGVEEAAARGRWGSPGMSRRLRQRTLRAPKDVGANWGRLPGRPTSEQFPPEPAHTLGEALHQLWEESPLGLRELAQAAVLPLSMVVKVLGGVTVASWPTTYTLVHLLGGRPDHFRPLWQAAFASPPLVCRTTIVGQRDYEKEDDQ